jgi:hypothetical protein
MDRISSRNSNSMYNISWHVGLVGLELGSGHEEEEQGEEEEKKRLLAVASQKKSITTTATTLRTISACVFESHDWCRKYKLSAAEMASNESLARLSSQQLLSRLQYFDPSTFWLGVPTEQLLDRAGRLLNRIRAYESRPINFYDDSIALVALPTHRQARASSLHWPLARHARVQLQLGGCPSIAALWHQSSSLKLQIELGRTMSPGMETFWNSAKVVDPPTNHCPQSETPCVCRSVWVAPW